MNAIASRYRFSSSKQVGKDMVEQYESSLGLLPPASNKGQPLSQSPQIRNEDGANEYHLRGGAVFASRTRTSEKTQLNLSPRPSPQPRRSRHLIKRASRVHPISPPEDIPLLRSTAWLHPSSARPQTFPRSALLTRSRLADRQGFLRRHSPALSCFGHAPRETTQLVNEDQINSSRSCWHTSNLSPLDCWRRWRRAVVLMGMRLRTPMAVQMGILHRFFIYIRHPSRKLAELHRYQIPAFDLFTRTVHSQISKRIQVATDLHVHWQRSSTFTMSSPSESLDIAELAIYLPLLFVTLFVVFRHGIHRQSGWIYLVIFCLIRIIGAALGISAERNPSNVSDLEWSAILGSVGISPLLLASLGLLKQMWVSLPGSRCCLAEADMWRQNRQDHHKGSDQGRDPGTEPVRDFDVLYHSRQDVSPSWNMSKHPFGEIKTDFSSPDSVDSVCSNLRRPTAAASSKFYSSPPLLRSSSALLVAPTWPTARFPNKARGRNWSKPASSSSWSSTFASSSSLLRAQANSTASLLVKRESY